MRIAFDCLVQYMFYMFFGVKKEKCARSRSSTAKREKDETLRLRYNAHLKLHRDLITTQRLDVKAAMDEP